MSAEVYLLLKSKSGRKNKKVITLTKGELLQSIPVDQQVENIHNDPPHNFRQCDDPKVTLAASEQDVVPLSGSEPLYLQAVELYSARSRMYASGTLQLVTKLKEGDDVSFMCEKGGIARGKIRNIGVHEDKPGIYFGIELLDEKHKKRSATSGVGNIIIVSADKLVLSNSSKSSKDGGSETTRKASDGGVTTHGRAVGKGEHSSVDQPKPGPLEKTKETFRKLWSSEPDQAPTGKHRFKVGDRVVMHSAQNFPVHGTVRWTGSLSAAKESNVDTPVVFAGIETDMPVDPATDFPDIHLDVTGSHGHVRFTVEKSHGRVYLPEQVILREDSTKCQLTGASEENLVAGHISGNSMSPEELKEQQEAMRNFEEQQARKEFAKKKGEYPHHLGPGGYEEHEHELNELKRVNRELRMKLREDSAPNIMGDNSYPRPPVSHFSESAFAGSAAERLGQGGGGMERGSNWPISEGGHFQTYAHSASSQHVLPTSAPGHEALSQQSPRIDSGGLGVSNPVQTHGPTLHDLEVSPLNAEAFLGIVVCPKSNPNMKGVVRWVGSLPHHRGGVIAGIELFEPYDGCTDGEHRGHRYFYCSPGKALFSPISHIQEVGRQTGGGLRNPLELIPEHEEYAVSGSSDLFDLYVGDGKGIQGHYNSCYLDSTVFALFALSDAFDALLFEKPTSEEGQKIRDIILKSIVNPLRKHGAARHESVMLLRNAVESLGTMKGANRDEKDPEEFLNMLFKNILNVRPFISIKRPFGIEEEFFIQLFFEIDNQSQEVPNSEKLLQKMFREQKISFTKIPSKLLLQMPRFGKEYKIFSRIIPAVSMDVKPMLDISAVGEQMCFICESRKADVGCKDCRSKYQVDLEYVFFCQECSGQAHTGEKTCHHKCEDLPDMGSAELFTKLELLSVVCIETSHYVCFTRTHEGRWLFHDSMANRVYDVYNIPRVIDVTDLLKEWVYDVSHGQRLRDTPAKQIPEIVRRFTQDIYMCVYVNPDLDMYGDGPSIGDSV